MYQRNWTLDSKMVFTVHDPAGSAYKQEVDMDTQKRFFWSLETVYFIFFITKLQLLLRFELSCHEISIFLVAVPQLIVH